MYKRQASLNGAKVKERAYFESIERARVAQAGAIGSAIGDPIAGTIQHTGLEPLAFVVRNLCYQNHRKFSLPPHVCMTSTATYYFPLSLPFTFTFPSFLPSLKEKAYLHV